MVIAACWDFLVCNDIDTIFCFVVVLRGFFVLSGLTDNTGLNKGFAMLH